MGSNRTFLNGWIVLCAGLLASSTSSFLVTVGSLGPATNVAAGFLDGLAVVAFGAAIAPAADPALRGQT